MNARYPWGDEKPEGRANCKGCDDAFGGKQAAPVGRYAANAYGLHDMAGNASEWVQDKFRDGERARVVRGGSWGGSPSDMRAADRYGGRPDGVGSGFIGFRVCRVAPIERQAAGALDAGPLKR